jgi:hypothetical protein
MITGVQVAERNNQVAGTKGSDIKTNGECVGTRYGVIYIGVNIGLYRVKGMC